MFIMVLFSLAFEFLMTFVVVFVPDFKSTSTFESEMFEVKISVTVQISFTLEQTLTWLENIWLAWFVLNSD